MLTKLWPESNEFMTSLNPIDILIDSGYSDAIVFDNPSYTDAIIGITKDNNVVYDYDLMVEWLMKTEGFTAEDAADFISYNSSYYYGNGYPIIYYEFCDEDEEQIEFIPLEELKNNV